MKGVHKSLRLLSSKQLILNPGKSKEVDFEFKADAKGEIYREIAFVSDGANAVEYVKVKAFVE